MGEKAKALGQIREAMEADESLPLRGQARLVFGEGDPEAKVVFVGEAPGFHEDRLGRPFVGRAGQLLDHLLSGIGWPRESVYITNIVRRRPPENRDPLPDEIAAYAPYLTRQLEVMQPKLVVALGRFAMNYFLPLAKISRDRGTAVTLDGRLIVPIYHPAAALRSTAVLAELEADFKKLPEFLRGWAMLIASASEAGPAAEAVRQASFF